MHRLGLIGDVHAEDALLDAAVRHLRTHGAEIITCTGDVADGQGSVDACCDILRDNDVIVVRGNHDRWLLKNQLRDLPDATAQEQVLPENRQYLASLPLTLEFESALGRALLCHGLAENDMSAVGPDDFGYGLESNTELQQILHDGQYPVVLNGHTHRRMVRRIASVTIINAGTLKRDHDPCVALLDFAMPNVAFWDLDARGTIVHRTTISLPR